MSELQESSAPTSTKPEGRDDGMSHANRTLRLAGVHVFESCATHTYPCRHKPFVRFYGDANEGPRVLGIAMEQGLPVDRLNYYYEVNYDKVCGPYWELEFLRSIVF